jgi:hypothetical protein
MTMMRRKFTESSLCRWLIFTAFFGVMPLIVRVTGALWQPDLHLPYITFPDVVLLGVIFNASAMANFSAKKWRPNVWSFFGAMSASASAVLWLLYFACYAPPFSGVMQSNAPLGLWIVAWVFLAFAIFMSFASSDDIELDAAEYLVEIGEMLREVPKEVQNRTLKILHEKYKERGLSVFEAAVEIFSRYGTAWLTDEEQAAIVAAALRPKNPLQEYLDAEVAKGNVPRD